jgi:hypothetical protein
MKKLFTKLIIILLFIFTGSAVDAHTTAIYTVNETDGSTTFYAQTYHYTGTTTYGGLILGSGTYNFTSVVSSLPSGAVQHGSCPRPRGSWYQVVNISRCGGTYSITTTSTSAVEAPLCSWPSFTFTASTPITGSITSDQEPVYYGYAPMACANLTANATGGSGTYNYYWYATGETTASINVCPTTSRYYFVRVSDASGNRCRRARRFRIWVDVVDVRCGKKLDKVVMCKAPGKSGKTVEICVAASAVPAHLANGATLGACPLAKRTNADLTAAMDIKTYPNPFSNNVNVSFKALTNENVRVEAFDITGKSLGILFNEVVEEGVYYNGGIGTAKFPNGLVLIKVQSASFNKIIKTTHFNN